MEKYITLLPYEVMDFVLNGKEVWMVDKKSKMVHCVNDMAVGDLAIAILGDMAALRFEFWYTGVETDESI